MISAATGSGVGSGVAVGSGVGVGVGSGVAVGASVGAGVAVGSGCAGAPQAARSAQSSANIRRREIRFFVAGVLSPAVGAGGFGSIIGRFEAKRQGTVFKGSLVQRELLSEAKLRDCSLQKATIPPSFACGKIHLPLHKGGIKTGKPRSIVCSGALGLSKKPRRVCARRRK